MALKAAVEDGQKECAARQCLTPSPRFPSTRGPCTALLRLGRSSRAADEYELLLSENGLASPAAPLSKRSQFEVAVGAVSTRTLPPSHDFAFELFLPRAYSNDPQTIGVSLLYGRHRGEAHAGPRLRHLLILDDISRESSRPISRVSPATSCAELASSAVTPPNQPKATP